MQARAERQITAQAERVMRVDDLARENARLRAMLELRPRLEVPSISAEILYATPDPYTRKVVIDRGGAHGVGLGSPVIDPSAIVPPTPARIAPLTAAPANISTAVPPKRTHSDVCRPSGPQNQQ